MRLLRVASLALVLLVGFHGLAGAVTITPYNDKDVWNTAVGSIATYVYTENFNDTTLESWLSITSDYGGTFGGPANSFQWQSRVDSNPVLNDTFFFSAPSVFAWSATLNLAVPGGAGEGINILANLVTAGGYQQAFQVPGTNQGWVGFIVTGDTFTSVQFRGANLNPNTIQETYSMDDLSIAGVPEPGTMTLLGLGLLGLGARRRLRK